jgi:putative serine protease PepD
VHEDSNDEPTLGGADAPGRRAIPLGDGSNTPDGSALPTGGPGYEPSPTAEVPPMPPPPPPGDTGELGFRWEPDDQSGIEPAEVQGDSDGDSTYDGTLGTHRAPKRKLWPMVAAIVISAALIGGGLGYGLAAHDSGGGTKPSAVALVEGTQAAPASNAAQMISRVLPSVVNVRVTEISSDPFGGTQSGRAEGSGVVLSKDGLIVTNAHVVSSATSVRVFFTNGHGPLDGTVLGVDTTHDLAVIKVQANDLKPITIGHSNTLKLVDDVYAIGFPLDLGPTVTRGVISGLDRTINVQRPDGSTEHLEGLLQTDAAINPGNSGGALVDAAGQLVGINTAGASAGEAENVGFAIAIDGAVPIIHQLAEGNSPTEQQSWLGVQVAADSDRQAALSQLGLPTDLRGAIVEGVVANGPAAGAGIRQGDVIVQLGDASIQSASDLTDALAGQKPGDEVQVRLRSTSGERTVTVTLGTRPAGLG